MQKIADVKDVLTKTGGERYGGEAISQLQHALQCASLAEAAHASPALISAALLHDIGHLVDRHSEDAAAAGIDRLHEKIGAGYLEKAFGPAVSIPVLLHVAAKRYLCAVDSRYFSGLSASSVQSLAVQGGPFNAAEGSACSGPYPVSEVPYVHHADRIYQPLHLLRHQYYYVSYYAYSCSREDG